MPDKGKELLTDILKKNKKQFIILIGAALVLLMLSSGDLFATDAADGNKYSTDVNAMEEDLERKLERFLKTVDGVGKVKVCIMYDILEETSYAVNINTDSDEYSSDYIIVEKPDGSEGGLPVYVRTPQIRGVAVACEGGMSAKVKNEVTALLTAALGVSANRVHVSAYSENSK